MEKTYYSISEVAEMLGVQQSALRFWEKHFVQLRPRLSSKGTRRYTEQDIEVVKLIIYYTRDCNLTIEGARARMTARFDADVRREKAIERLRSIRAEIVAIRRELNDREAMAEEVIVD